MEDDNNKGEGNDNSKAAPAALLHAILGGGNGSPFTSAEGAGALFEQTREFIEDSTKPELIEVRDPHSGTIVLATVTSGGVMALPTSFFDGERDSPRFRRGTATMTSLDSFIDHVNRFEDSDSTIFADDNRKSPGLLAVLDYHRSDTTIEGDRAHGEYRFGRHRTAFLFPVSDEWKTWTGKNHAVMSMVEFSAFLEKNIGDIALPDDAFPEATERFVNANGGPDSIASYGQLLELSRGLKVHEDAVVEEANVLATGEGHIRFSSEHRTRDGLGNVVKVPTMFFICVPVFNKGTYYRIPAALRYRKTPEGVKFWFDLWREDRSFDDAFNDAIVKVKDETGLPVLFGAPEAG